MICSGVVFYFEALKEPRKFPGSRGIQMWGCLDREHNFIPVIPAQTHITDVQSNRSQMTFQLVAEWLGIIGEAVAL